MFTASLGSELLSFACMYCHIATNIHNNVALYMCVHKYVATFLHTIYVYIMISLIAVMDTCVFIRWYAKQSCDWIKINRKRQYGWYKQYHGMAIHYISICLYIYA